MQAEVGLDGQKTQYIASSEHHTEPKKNNIKTS